jgi:polysaccharide pyruvyl transferase WcaK-like protein
MINTPLQADMSDQRKSGMVSLLGIPVSSRNQGVRALGAALVDLCTLSPGCRGIRLLTGNSAPETVVFHTTAGGINVPLVNYRLSPRCRLHEHLAWIVMMAIFYHILPFSCVRRLIVKHTPWIATLEESDFAGDVRGGDSFSDIYGMRRYVVGFLAAWTVLLVKGTMVQFPQTYGPYKSPLARFMARFLLRRSTVIVARDKVSQRIAQDLVGAPMEVGLSPDVAFSLAAVRPGVLSVDPALDGSLSGRVIGLNVNGLMYRGGYTRNNMFGLKMDYPGFLRHLVTSLLAGHEGELWLIPHTYAAPGDVESDPEASRELRESLPSELRARVRIVSGEYDPHEVKWIIGQCDFFIGSRMHSCIGALSQGVPCVGVAYSMKFRGVFESVGMEDWVVDGREVDEEESVRCVMELYRMRDNVRVDLAANAEAARTRLKEVFAGILKTAAGNAQ